MEAEQHNQTQLTPSQFKNFRLFLQAELVRRCEKNPSYSLRAFARSLNIHHSALSRILRGKRGLSKNVFTTLAEALNLGPKETEAFKKNISFDDESSGADFQDLTIDTFTVISEWYHDAILELMQLKNFKTDPKWISKVLGITVSEVNIAIERLVRLDLIDINAKGEWISHAAHTEVGIDSPYTTAALRKYQKQILKMAIGSIDEISRDRRHNISSTVAIDTNDLDEVKKLINQFRRKLSKFVQRKNVKADQVYQLGICFYPLTKKNKKGSES